jgi:hypothetical protein
LPAASILVGITSKAIIQIFPRTKNFILALLFAFCVERLITGYNDLNSKSLGQQNWKGASIVLVENANNKHIYYTTNRTRYWRQLIANFYINKLSNGKLVAKEYVVGKTMINRPALIIFGHENNIDLLMTEMKKINASQIFEGYDPSFMGGGAAGVFLVE